MPNVCQTVMIFVLNQLLITFQQILNIVALQIRVEVEIILEMLIKAAMIKAQNAQLENCFANIL
uniref:Candidate secreted effector n=1 Tax=Meloidogyne incognita TaxID=6306 RepID=A0A914N465_MELIC